MSAASNTKECILEFVGQEMIGVIYNRFPLNRIDLSRGTKTLIFNNRRGLTFADNGSYWAENENDIKRVLDIMRYEMEENRKMLNEVMNISGLFQADSS